MTRMKKIIGMTIVGLTLLVSSVSAADGYTLLDSADVSGYAGSAFVMLALGFVVVGAVVLIKILVDR